MTRRKVKLAWIEKEVARKVSLGKRRAGLMKKVSELTTLCGVQGMCLIYGPEEEHPPVWPSHEVVKQMLMNFLSLSEIKRSKKMTNQEGYLRDAILKAQENKRKELQKLQKIELTWLVDKVGHGKRLDKLDSSQLNCLAWLIQEKIQEIRKRIELAGLNPQGRVEEEDQDRKPDLDLEYMAIMKRHHSGVSRRFLTVWPGGGEEGGSGSGCLGRVEIGLRLGIGRDGYDEGSGSMDTGKAPAVDEMELFPGGGGGSGR